MTWDNTPLVDKTQRKNTQSTQSVFPCLGATRNKSPLGRRVTVMSSTSVFAQVAPSNSSPIGITIGRSHQQPCTDRRLLIVARPLWRLLRPPPPTASKEAILHTGTIEWTVICTKPFPSDPPPSYPSHSLQAPYLHQAHTRVFSNETSSVPY
jgi:hypothetical protein